MRLLSNKNSNILIGALSAVLLLAFLWRYSETGVPPALSQAADKSNRIGFYLLQSNSKQFDQWGKIETSLYSDQLENYPLKKQAIMTNPVVKFYDNGVHTWTVTSRNGLIRNKGQRVDFSQQVVITSTDGKNTMKTPLLYTFPERKIAKTPKPVTLETPEGFTRAVGMEAQLTEKRVQLLNNVRGQYHAIQ
jgi:lipopolysaccharide export system protein LptC